MTNLLRFIPRIFFHAGKPLQLIFFITSRCNLKCKHCFYSENLNKTKNELSLEEIEKISHGMGNLLWLALTGGEPFLRRDITKIAKMFYRNNKLNFLTITTNGILQDQIINAVSEICESCKNAHLVVYVSIDGLEETHNSIRGTDDGFKKAINTIKELKKLKKQFKNFNVATVTTCNAENQKEMKPLAIFIKDEIKPDTMTVNLLRGAPRLSPLGEIDIENYFDFIKVQEESWEKGELGHLNLMGSTVLKRKELLQKKIIATIFRENRYILPCLAGNISAVLTENGDFFPCELLDKKIGNIRDVNFNFSKLWFSTEAHGIRRFIKDTHCFCTFECALSTNILFNITQLVKMCVKT